MRYGLMAAALGTALVAVAALTPASATAIYVSHAAYTFSAFVQVSDAAVFGSSNPISGAAGQFNVVYNYGVAPGTPSYQGTAWCVDLADFINVGSGTLGNNTLAYSTTTLGGVNAGFSQPALNAAQQTRILQLASYGNDYLANVTNTDKNNIAAAVQEEIWNTEYNTSYATTNIYSGGVAGIIADIASVRSAITSYPISPYLQSLVTTAAPVASYGQSLLLFVPEPASMALFASGLFGLGMLRRRRNRRAA